jgi:hypothetical protein
MDRAVTWASEADRQRDLRRRRRAERKHKVFMFAHGVFWKTLHTLWLARPYSIAMCWLNLYRRFPDGRCMWCGSVHISQKQKETK